MAGKKVEDQANKLTYLMPEAMRRLFTLDIDDPTNDLPIAQLRVCSILREGPKPICSLANDLGITASAATQLADRLERAGIVERIAGESDRRVKSLHLTAYGDKIMHDRRQYRISHASKVLESLPPKVVLNLVDSLQALLEIESNDDCRALDIDTIQTMEAED